MKRNLNTKQNLLEWMDRDGDKPVALLSHHGYGGRGTLFTRDPNRIRAICSQVVLPEASWQRAEFPEGMEGLTVWTEDSVILLLENYEGGTSITQALRNPLDGPDSEWVTA